MYESSFENGKISLTYLIRRKFLILEGDYKSVKYFKHSPAGKTVTNVLIIKPW